MEAYQHRDSWELPRTDAVPEGIFGVIRCSTSVFRLDFPRPGVLAVPVATRYGALLSIKEGRENPEQPQEMGPRR